MEIEVSDQEYNRGWEEAKKNARKCLQEAVASGNQEDIDYWTKYLNPRQENTADKLRLLDEERKRLYSQLVRENIYERR